MMEVQPMSGRREGQLQIAGWFDPRDVFTFKEVLMRESRERGRKKSVQEAMDEMLADYMAKQGVTLPSRAAAAKGKGKG